MLDRILNINPQEKYKSGLKIISNPYTVNRHNQERHPSKDSALFSPIARLMSKINWRILNVEYPSDEEMLLNFLVNGLEFITVINFGEMYKNPYQEFSIFQQTSFSGKKRQNEIKLKVEKNNIGILDTPDPIRTQTISHLFDRVDEFAPEKNCNIVEEYTLNRFTANIGNELNMELN